MSLKTVFTPPTHKESQKSANYRVLIGGGDEQVMPVWRKRHSTGAGCDTARPARLDQVEIIGEE
jgi:hypothetical protein